MVIATLLAAIGILTDSAILIVGAMVVGPEFGPLAALCVAVVRRRPAIARRAVAALSVGFAAAITASFLVTLALRQLSLGPDALGPESRAQTFFISHPDTFSVLVALLAGTAGMLSLSTAKSGALIGRAHLRDDDPGGRQHRCRRRVRGLERMARRNAPTCDQPLDDRAGRSSDARRGTPPLSPQEPPAGLNPGMAPGLDSRRYPGEPGT